MITISICDKRNKVEIDIMLEGEQRIEEAFKIIEEKGIMKIGEIEYVRLGNKRLKSKKLTFQQAEIYTGEKLIIE